ncbi:hypothetical protein KO465_09155 [Candidatus Micrarchaeota archaeon]|nr:hypothetical protein [Candidatus Micrarchaeota archaeon]
MNIFRILKALMKKNKPQLKADYWKRIIEDELLTPIVILNENKKQFLRLAESFNSKEVDKEVFYFARRNYISFMSLAIRRMVDTNSRSHSLLNLLKDLKENHSAIQRSWFLKQYPGAKGESLYECFFGGGESISQVEIQSDIEELVQYTRAIKDRADRWEAHWDKKRTKLKQNPTFDDLHRAVEVIIKIYTKYYYLLTQSAISID